MRLSLTHRVPSGWLMLAWLAGALSAPAYEPAAEKLEEAWRLGVQGRFTEAAEIVPGTPDEEARFTRALLLFNRQPRTAADMAEAEKLLSALARDGGTPAVRARSLYFWARAETLRAHDDPAGGLKLYEQLWRDYPAESYGQRALVHRLLIAIYADEPRATVLTQCAALEREAGAITDQVVRSHFHQVAARGYLHLGGAEAQALEHLLQVDALGVTRREAWSDLQVSIGQLAAEQGRPAVARTHYELFLKEFPSDPRAYTVRALLAALPADETKTAVKPHD